LLAALTASPAAAGDLVWEVAEAWNARTLEADVSRWAGEGYSVQAVVLAASQPTLLLAREGRRRLPPVADYRVLGRADAGSVEALAADGWRLHRAGLTRNHEAVVVLSRPARAKAPGNPVAGERPALRSLDLPADLAAAEALLTPLYDAGLVVVAALGTAAKNDWLLLDRPAGARREREVRLVSAKGTAPLATMLDALARDGYGVDALWSRPGGGFLLGGTREVVAVASRTRLAAGEHPRPVAHTRLEVGLEPSLAGTLVAVASYGSKLVFAVRDAPSKSYDVQTVTLPTTESGKELEAWDRLTALRERLDSYAWHPVERAWFAWGSTQPSGLVLIEPESLPTSTRPVASSEERRAPAVPAGAEALPADGGPPAVSWWAERAAVAQHDVKRAKALWTGEKLASWEENVKRFKAPFGLGFSEKELFAGAADDLATDPVVLGGWQRGDDALLRVEATADGERAVADITLQRVGGVWKVASESAWHLLSTPAP
jgi:hypothetical protein